MNDNVKPIRIMAITAIVLQAIETLIFFIIHSAPSAFLSLLYSSEIADSTAAVNHPLLYVVPLLRLIAVVLFGWVLLSECKKPSGGAGVLMILIPVSTVVLGIISYAMSIFIASFLTRLVFSAKDAAAMSMLNSLTSITGLITAPVFPLLAAAAGANWFRKRNSLQ